MFGPYCIFDLYDAYDVMEICEKPAPKLPETHENQWKPCHGTDIMTSKTRVCSHTYWIFAPPKSGPIPGNFYVHKHISKNNHPREVPGSNLVHLGEESTEARSGIFMSSFFRSLKESWSSPWSVPDCRRMQCLVTFGVFWPLFWPTKIECGNKIWKGMGDCSITCNPMGYG